MATACGGRSGRRSGAVGVVVRGVGLGAVRRTVRSFHGKRFIVVMSSRSHRGRNSLMITTKLVAPRGMGFVLGRTENMLYTPVAVSHYRRLSLPRRMSGGASMLKAPFAIAVSGLRKYAANMSTTSHTTAVHTLTSPASGPRAFNHPKRIGPLCTRRGNMLHHTKRARTYMSVTHLTNLCPTTTLVRIVGRSNAVTHLPRLGGVTSRCNFGLVSVTSLVTCHLGRRSLMRGKIRMSVPARRNRFHLVPFHRGDGNLRRMTLVGNAFSRSRPMLMHMRSSYTANSVFNSVHYSYNSRLRGTVRRVRGRKGKTVVCLGRRKHNVKLVRGVGTCGLRRRKVSAMSTGVYLNRRTSRHSCKMNTRVLHRVNVRGVHLLAGGPIGHIKLRTCKLRVMRGMPVRIAPGPCGRHCLRAGGREVKRALRFGGWVVGGGCKGGWFDGGLYRRNDPSYFIPRHVSISSANAYRRKLYDRMRDRIMRPS